MKKMAYFMHVPWSWIKQRPHFIAEKINDSFDIRVLQNKPYNFIIEKVENKTDLKIEDLWRLPLLRYNIIRKLNNFLIKNIIMRKNKECDYLFLLYPLQYSFVKKSDTQKLIYDCMDDHVAMCSNEKLKKEIYKLEKELIEDADLVLFSSDYLKKIILGRYNLEKINSKVLNNGINIYEKKGGLNEKIYFEKNNLKKITYIGTISSWFDTELILKILEAFKNIEFHIFGPCEIKLPEHPRLKVRGLLEHKEVDSVMKQSDALIMPFVLNDIVLSVNPVKAYEYISAKKPIFLINYDETKKFEEYCYLYDNFLDIKLLLEKLEQNKLEFKGKDKDIEKYLLNNSWNARVEELKKEINKL